jgi:hypothetical protein
MRRPQVNIRTLLILILVFGVVLGFAIAALEVLRSRDVHTHTYVRNRRGRWVLGITYVDSPFWPRYWRRLLGMSWRKQPLCRASPELIEEVCSFAQPEIAMFKKADFNRSMIRPTPKQSAVYLRLQRRSTSSPPQ